MELSFSGGKFVSFDSELNYQDVIKDFETAKTIRIITYNISKNQRNDRLLELIKDTDADVQIITNVPSRMAEYYNSPAGERMRSSARNNIQIYISKLDPDKFGRNFKPFFNVQNHAKLIGTENIVYIGSANYSSESANNIETGVLIEDKEFIQDLYSEFFDKVRDNSLSYFDDEFSAFRLYVLSLYAKFNQYHKKLLQDLYTDYERTKMVVADNIFIDYSDLQDLYLDLDELEQFIGFAEDTYAEENEEYNEALEQLKNDFARLSIDWLKSVIEEDGSLYKLVEYNIEQEANCILQTEFAFEAYDDQLDEYAERAMNMASDAYSSLHDDFSLEADDFLAEIERILQVLSSAITFTDMWKASRINPEIDNT